MVVSVAGVEKHVKVHGHAKIFVNGIPRQVRVVTAGNMGIARGVVDWLGESL